MPNGEDDASDTSERPLLRNKNSNIHAKWQQASPKTYSHRYIKRTAFAVAAIGLVTIVALHVHSLSSIDTRPSHVTSNSRHIYSPSGVRKAVVAAQWEDHDATWITKLLPDWEMNVYDTSQMIYIPDDLKLTKDTSFTSKNGREAAPYLSYIVDNYDNLPDYMVFYHGPRYQWHNDDPMFDGYPTIANLSLDFVDEQGYVPLRCNAWPGCDGDPMHVEVDKPDWFYGWRHLIADMHEGFWPGKPVPEELEGPCCAQFAVSRQTVQMNSHDDYKLWQKWISSHTWGLGINKRIGLAFEFQWQIMFGKPASWCPMSPKECYCKTWNLCDLDCNKLKCKGRWFRHKKGYETLVEGWPDEKVQGTKGWPKEGWWNHLDENWDHELQKDGR